MIQFNRSGAQEQIEHRGRTYTLVTTSWTAHLITPWVGLGWSYTHPTAIQSESGSGPVHDYLMWARVAVFVVAMFTTLARRSSR